MPAVVYVIHPDSHTLHGNSKPSNIGHVTLTWSSPSSVHGNSKPSNICSCDSHMTPSSVQVQRRKSFVLDGQSWEPSIRSPETTTVKGHPLRSRTYGPQWLPSVARCSGYATACCHTTTPCSTKPAAPLTPWMSPQLPFLSLSSLSSPRTVIRTALTDSSWLEVHCWSALCLS